MTDRPDIPDAANWAHDPPPGRLPECRSLRLPDGYMTEMHVYHPPAGVPGGKTPVVCIHGIQSHPRWYARSAIALADVGYVVYQPTRRGSGRNAEARGVAASADQLYDDVDAVLDAVRADTGAERVHFVAVSWGGKFLTTGLTCRRRLAEAAASLTLVAPGIVPQVQPPAMLRFGQAWLFGATRAYPMLALAMAIVAAIGGWSSHDGLFRIGVIGALSFLALTVINHLVAKAALGRMYSVPLGPANLFTDNPAMQRYLDEDAESLRTVVGRFSAASREMDRALRRGRRGSLTVPTTLILARRDRIIRNDATQRVIERLTDGKANVIEMDGCHTLEFEDDPAAYHAALIGSMRTVSTGGET